MTDLQTTLSRELPAEITDALATTNEELVPCLYAITGSHLYGTETPGSDIDIKGFHCAPGRQYLTFDAPAPQQKFTTSVSTTAADIEVTSYELKKFGDMLYHSDFSLVELICGEMAVYTRSEQILTGVEAIYADQLPAELPRRYLGMAESIYDRDLVEAPPTTVEEIKPLVYALRGCLAAEYVQTHTQLEPQLLPLAEALLGDEQLQAVEQFVAAIQHGEIPTAEILSTVGTVIEGKLDALNPTAFTDTDRAAYKTELAEWMLAVRDHTGTR
jgi:predicted nucleotidyltransferase